MEFGGGQQSHNIKLLRGMVTFDQVVMMVSLGEVMYKPGS